MMMMMNRGLLYATMHKQRLSSCGERNAAILERIASPSHEISDGRNTFFFLFSSSFQPRCTDDENRGGQHWQIVAGRPAVKLSIFSPSPLRAGRVRPRAHRVFIFKPLSNKKTKKNFLHTSECYPLLTVIDPFSSQPVRSEKKKNAVFFF